MGVDQEDKLSALIAELAKVRKSGLLKLHELDLPLLTECVGKAGVGDEPSGAAVEKLLRLALERLDEQVEAAAAYTFGLKSGTRIWAAADRRKHAAEACKMNSEQFRKKPEKNLLRSVADSIMEVCAADWSNGSRSAEEIPIYSTQLLSVSTANGEGTVILHHGPVETLSDVDVLVSSENTYLEMGKTYSLSLSGSIRRAAAILGDTGAILDDVLQRELRQWLLDNGLAPGLSVTPGVVVPTSSGKLRDQGIRRIYHAATAYPRGLTHTYYVSPNAVRIAVRRVFALARSERDDYDPPLRSICFPLFGAGRGALLPTISFGYLWSALEQELTSTEAWEIHLITRSPAGAAAVRDALGKLRPPQQNPVAG